MEPSNNIERDLEKITIELSKSNREIILRYDEIKTDEIASSHLKLHKDTEVLVSKLAEKKIKIPKETIVELNRSKNNLHIIEKSNLRNKNQTNQPAEFVHPDTDTFHLLTTVKKPPYGSYPDKSKWSLNFGLLYSIHQRTTSEDIRKSLRFLMFNYLSKAAYLNNSVYFRSLSKEFEERYEQMLQLGNNLLGGLYHRSRDISNSIISDLGLDREIGLGNSNSNNVALETTHIEDLYYSRFIPIFDLSNTQQVAEILANEFTKNTDLYSKKPPKFPVLIDITNEIGQDLITSRDPEKISLFRKKRDAIKSSIDEIYNLSLEMIKEKKPSESKDRILNYLKINTFIVSRLCTGQKINSCRATP